MRLGLIVGFVLVSVAASAQSAPSQTEEELGMDVNAAYAAHRHLVEDIQKLIQENHVLRVEIDALKKEPPKPDQPPKPADGKP